MYASTREEELRPVPWTDEEKALFVRHQFEAQDAHYRTNLPDVSYDVVEIDGVAAGRLYVGRWDEELRVVDIALLPEHRGRGIGSQLLGSVIDEAARVRKKVSIHVERFNPARRLYERLGFVEVSAGDVHVLMERPANG